MTIHEILHDIVKLLPHRQEALDELHARIDQLDAEPPDPRVARMEELQAQIPDLVAAVAAGNAGSGAALQAATAELQQLGTEIRGNAPATAQEAP